MEVKTYEPSNHRVRMLIYGASGIGKTVFGSTAPKPLFLAVEEGLLSLSDKKAQYVKIKSLQDMRDILAALKANKLMGPDGKPLEYETIVIDSLTEVQQVVIQNVTGGRQPSMNEWGQFADKMAEILKGFCALDKHIVFTCLESEKAAEDDDGKEYTRFQPELFGKLAEKAQAMMDFVGRFYMKTAVVNERPTQVRTLTFTITAKWKAKDRSGKMPQFVEPDFSKIVQEFAKIKIGEGTVVGSAESGMDVSLTFPPTPKDKICSKEQQAEIKEAWAHLMRVFVKPDGSMVPETEHDARLGATMKKHCGVDTTTKLRAGQASQFFSYILDTIKKFEPQDRSTVDAKTGEVTTPIDEQTPADEAAKDGAYDVMADLKRREELNAMVRDELEGVADLYKLDFTAKTKKPEIIDMIIAKEFPNAPKEKPKA